MNRNISFLFFMLAAFSVKAQQQPLSGAPSLSFKFQNDTTLKKFDSRDTDSLQRQLKTSGLNLSDIIITSNGRMPVAKLRDTDHGMPIVQTDRTGYTMPVVGLNNLKLYQMKKPAVAAVTPVP